MKTVTKDGNCQNFPFDISVVINPDRTFIKQSPLWRRRCSSASQEVPYLVLNVEDS